MRGDLKVGRNSQTCFLEIFEKIEVYTFCLYILGHLFPLRKIFVFNSFSFSPVDETKKEMKDNLFSNSNARRARYTWNMFFNPSFLTLPLLYAKEHV